ncbi:MAG: ATP-dependent chaperone ClpB, partial [Parcubacteria group bacterium GW2011_GWF2_44_8]
KAIDLMDEAASAIRIEIDSKPIEIDKLERKIRQLEIEKAALGKEKDPTSAARLQEIEKLIAELQENYRGLELQWKSEKEIINTIKESSKKIDLLREEANQAERDYNLQRVAEIKYGEVPKHETAIAAAKEKLTAIQQGRHLLKEEVTAEDIARVVARWTGIPVEKMLTEENERLLHLEEQLAKRVMSQEAAIKAVANAIRRNKTGIGEEGRPIGSFLFLGPTGVGKTELAKALAELLFNDERHITRIDMSEYMEKHSVSRLIGAPPGYVGYEEGGQLTEAVRQHPYTVILLDEIEKAHSEVFNILLQVLDDGRLTDSKGRTVNFKNTIIIMTSNLGSNLIAEYRDLPEKQQEVVQELLKQTFKPEFLNRLDETLIFQPLAKEQLEKIVTLQLEKVKERLQTKNITLSFAPELVKYLAKHGYDELYGARPLKRLIQHVILDALSLQLIEGKLKAGDIKSVSISKTGVIELNSGKK